MLKKIFSYFYNPAISYGITVCNEHKELDVLLSTLLPLIDKKDEVIVLQDVTRRDEKVSAVLEKYESRIKHIENQLNGDFASFKNNLINATTKDFLFQIDADEIPQPKLISELKSFLKKEIGTDCVCVPRINTVEGITEEYIQKWNWKINEKGYINFPDYQQRILKLNGKIKWKNKVHEELFGFKKMKNLPMDYDYCLLHPKEIKRQIAQNEHYDSIG